MADRNANDFLPEPLPASPLPLLTGWFDAACRTRAQPNPDAMVLATVDTLGRPAARVVLCKQLVANPGYVVFYTNYHSRKGRSLDGNGRAAAVFHWDVFSRQARLEGRVLHSPAAESDAYFASRPIESRIGAWASEQSAPLASRAALAAQVQSVAARFGIEPGGTGEVPRPPHWGGYRLWLESVELWVEGPGRVHDRAIWQRELQPLDEHGFTTGPWQATRLNP